MRIGFYYHVGTVEPDGVRLPSHMAMFVRELAAQAGSVVFYGHSGCTTPEHDAELRPPAVVPVDLGPRRSFPRRTFLPAESLRRFHPERDGIDVMLVRGPSPLLPHLVRRSSVPVAVLLVGDYRGWRPASHFPWWRNLLIAGWVQIYALQQRRVLNRALVLCNSPTLAEDFGGREVFTSSFSSTDLEADASVRCRGPDDRIRLLFTGRITEEKGLFEVVEAMSGLVSRGHDLELEVVGWADDPQVTEMLESRSQELGVRDRLRLAGYRPAGPELSREYREADIFVMASRAEGFPRSVAEAMAHGLPVVASRVGGLAAQLEDGRSAVLVDPGSPASLAEGLERVIQDTALRARLSDEGRRWARSRTNERSCSLIVAALEEFAR